MTFPDITADLARAMPQLRGRLKSEYLLANLCWFRTGGAAQILFTPADEEDLAYFLERLDPDIAVTVVGVGSNLLVRDGGIEGVVVRLGKGFHDLRANGLEIEAGARVLDVKLASHSSWKPEYAGLSFYRGIPGADRRRAADECGRLRRRDQGCSRFLPRHRPSRSIACLPQRGDGFHLSPFRRAARSHLHVRPLFEGSVGDRAAIEAQMAEITKSREETQPVNTRTGGSTFKNPEGRRAWELIDAAGCRGLVLGDAQVSELHCNFLVNRGRATSADLENLGEEVRRRVHETSGVKLEWEIERIGKN